MKKLKRGKVVALSLILVLAVAIGFILKISSIDKYAGLVTVKNATLSSISTKLSANISDLTEENKIYTKGYDEIDYTIKYRLSSSPVDRDVIINAKIDENDPYATFKEITGSNITSTLSADRKEIVVTISNLPADEEITSKITLLIVNAPNGYTVSPTVRIKESTASDYSDITVTPVTVNTNSLQGYVTDEDGNIVKGVLVALKKNNEIIKETYTNDNGLYTLSDITPDTYSVVINEDIYDDIEVNNLYIEDGNMLNLIVRRVYPYRIETNKYITKVELSNLGTSKDYTYNDVELAQIPVKKVNDLHGKIYYKIVVKNTGEKAGMITMVKDELPEGLSFDENLNSGYELKNGIIYNRNLEGLTLDAGEQIVDTLVLTIDNTNVARTYINQVSAKGELYENVVYLLDGNTYKTLDVLEGEYLDELTISDSNFDGWYTDEKLTNKYNYNNPVTKDLILYGVTKAKHTVTFNDKDPETLDETEYDKQTIPNGDPARKPSPDPSHTGYTFCGWDTDNGTHWDFNTPVTSDLTLTSCYEINTYHVEFYDNSASDGSEYELISTIDKNYNTTLSNAEAPSVSWEGHNFVNWTTDPAGQNAYDFTAKITGNVKLYSQWTLQDRLFIFNDENRITNVTVEYGSTVTEIASQGKEGHTFKWWSLTSNGPAFDFNTKIYQTTTVYAVYQINTYDVIFNDVDPRDQTTTEYDRQPIEHGSQASEPTPDPSKEGYNFCGWYLGNNEFDFDTPITGSITLTSCYEIIKLNVTFMDEGNVYHSTQVDYGSTVTAPSPDPTKTHYTFKFWSEDNTNAFNYTTQIKQDKTLYSVYEEILPPTISHTPLYWTNDRVVVTINSGNANYSVKYKVDDGTYTDYSAPFEISTNSTIIAKNITADGESTLASHEITNIDKLLPTIGTLAMTPTQTSVLINVPVTDSESGVQNVNIYKDNVLAGNVNGTAVNQELRDYTKSKDVSFLLNGLTPNNTYSIKIEVIDGAGNVAVYTESVTTVPAEPVARIISIDGVPLNPEDYIEFPLLALAIADTNCSSKCTIQMMKSTNESVSILDTQDITLDLAGYTVSGTQAGYTVSNEGEFTLIDSNTTEPGAIANPNGIAVLNNTGAKFTMGEGSSEPPSGSETRIVYTTYPVVFGATIGLYNETGAEFAFFDGKVKGESAIQGAVTETEYTYNASSNIVEAYEEVTLAQLDNPEARINKSKYYTNIANAVRDSKIGTVSSIEDDSMTFLSGFSHTDAATADYDTPTGYTFIYDATNDTLTSTNDYYGSRAFAETIVDLSTYSEDQLLELQYHITENNDGTKGKAMFYVNELDENYNMTNTKPVQKIYGEGITGYQLIAGKRYKVIISFTQTVQMTKAEMVENPNGGLSATAIPSYSAESQLVVTKGTLNPISLDTINYNVINTGVETYGFYYDSTTDTYRSNNQYANDSSAAVAYSYIEIDLTNKPGQYLLSVTASMESYSGSTGKVFISENNEIPYNRYSSECLLYMNSGSNGRNNGAEEYYNYPTYLNKMGPYSGNRYLDGNKKYYLYFYYEKSYGSFNTPREVYEQYNVSDQLIINAVKLVKVSNSESLSIPDNMVGTAVDSNMTLYGNGGQYYSISNNDYNGYRDSYIKIDLTNSDKDKLIGTTSWYYSQNFVRMYLTSNNRGVTNNVLISNEYNNLLTVGDNSNTMPYAFSTYSGSSYGSYYTSNPVQNYALLEKGNVYYFHINYKLGYYSTKPADYGFDCYNEHWGDCGGFLRDIYLIDADETLINFGKYHVYTGTEDYDLQEEDTNTVTLSDSDTLTLKGGEAYGYVYDSNTESYSLAETIPYNGLAIFNNKIDLTGETEAKTYEITSTYQNYNNHMIVISKGDMVPARMVRTQLVIESDSPYMYSVYFNQNQYFTLDPGYVYYVTDYLIGGYNGTTENTIKITELQDNRTREYVYSNRLITFNREVDEIQLLKDINLQSTMVVNAGKEVVLDLNGYGLTSTLGTPVVDNYGKLTIIDSDYKSQTSENKVHHGSIGSSAGDVVLNEEYSKLILEDVVINVDGEYSGINNYGELVIAEDTDSKIYVNGVGAKGINNRHKGRIFSDFEPLEIIMNYNNQADYTNKSIYSELEKDSINTGICNYGYLNIKHLKISGRNGTGVYNYYSDDQYYTADNPQVATVIISDSEISIDMNTYDKNNDYKAYYSSGWNPIRDYSVYNYDSGYMSLYSVRLLGRLSNGGQMLLNFGSTVDQLSNNGSLVAINGVQIDNANLGQRSKTKLEYGSGVKYTTNVDYYAELSIYNGNRYNDAVLNNRGIVDTGFADLNIINNYSDGKMTLTDGSAVYLLNEGEATLSSIRIDTTGTNYDQAILNSGVLNLLERDTIISTGTYGILNIPKQEQNSVEYYDNSGRKTYNEITYDQTLLNIGNEKNEIPSIEIYGTEYGVTGSCYQNAVKKYYNDKYVDSDEKFKDTKFIRYLDGTREALTQANYDQSLCVVNMYSGYIHTDSNSTYNPIDIPIVETNDNPYAFWSSGLVVTSKEYAEYKGLTRTNVKIGSQEFISIKDAIDSVTTNDPTTIDVTRHTYNVGRVTIPEGRNITLNFADSTNQYILSNDAYLVNNGNLTVNLGNSSILHMFGKYGFENNGNITFNDGTYYNAYSHNYNESSIFKNNGNATINNIFTSAIDLYNTGNMVINSGDFYGTMIYGIGNNSVSTIKGGSYYTRDWIPTYYSFYTALNTPYIDTSRHMFELANGATAIFDGFDSTSSQGYMIPIGHLDNSTIEFRNSNFVSPTAAEYPLSYVAAENNSSVIFNDGTYNNMYININSSTLTVNDGTINNNPDYDLAYLHGESPKANIISGTLESTNSAIVLSDYKYPSDPEAEQYAYKIIIGTKGDLDEHNQVICSKTDPVIKADSYGVVSRDQGGGAGYLGFYDGIVKGISNTLDVSIDDYEDNYEIMSDTEVIDTKTYHTTYLDQADLVKNNTKNKIYKSFQTAFNEADSGDELVTLRAYTNASATDPITVAAGKSFTLKVAHEVTINNSVFIENSGDLTLTSVSDGRLNANATCNIVVNDGTLNLNDLNVVNVKSSSTSGSMFINNLNATMNVNGSNITMLQNPFVTNYGTLSIDKNIGGTSSCYNTTRIKVNYVPGSACYMLNPAIVNEGTADIDYLNITSDNFCKLITNQGTMTIDNSVLDQTSSDYSPSLNAGNIGGPIISTTSNGPLSINNSKFLFIPGQAYYTATYANDFFYTDINYISSGGIVNIDDSMFDLSIAGFAYSNGQLNVSDSTVHTNSYGIIYSSKQDITLTNNTFDCRDSIIDGRRAYHNDIFSSYKEFEYFSPSAYNPTGTIRIDGGVYNSKGLINPFTGSYNPIEITYSSTCTNGTMDSHSSNPNQARSYRGVGSGGGHINAYSNAITNMNTLYIDDAIITLQPDDNPRTSYNYLEFDIYGYTDNIYGSDGFDSTHNQFATITNFKDAYITDSEVSSSWQYVTTIIGRGPNAHVVIGTKDGNYDNQKPYITSNNAKVIKSMRGNTKVDFYDGLIESDNNINIDRLFDDIEDHYTVTGTNTTRYLTQEKVIKNISKDVEYTSIQDAINAASSGDNLKIIATSVVSPQTQYSINNKNLSIDLNGLIVGNKFNVTGTSSVTVSDSQNSDLSLIYINSDDTATINITGGSGEIESNGTSTINVTGTVNYSIDAYDSSNVNFSSADVDRYVHDKDIIMHDSSIVSIDDSYVDALYLYDQSDMSVQCTNNSSTYVEDYTVATTTAISIPCGTYRYTYVGRVNGNTYVNSTVNITGGNISNLSSYDSTINATDVSIDSLSGYGTSTISLTNVTSTNYVSAEGNTTLNIYSGSYDTINSGYNYSSVETPPTAITNIYDGSVGRVLNSGYSTINVYGGTYSQLISDSVANSVMNIGVKDGNIDDQLITIDAVNNPGSSSSKYGLIIRRGTVNFYDGTITGSNSYGAIYGLVADIEPNYRIDVTDNGVDAETAKLVPISSADPRVAMVNGINYNNLQTAINKSVLNCDSGICPDVTIYLNITLDADLINNSSYTVNIISNGYTINTGSYNVPSNITLDGEPIVSGGLGGDIINGIRNALGATDNTKDIIVYEMSDGSSLSTENHYRLYSYNGSDYDLVEMDRDEEVARYTPGRGVTNMKPIKGRLYLTGLEAGSYKVTDDNGSEVTFTINDDGSISGHVKEYVMNKDARVEATGMAKLVITIQTGIRKVNYMLIAISLIAVLSVMFVIQKRNQNKKNLV